MLLVPKLGIAIFCAVLLCVFVLHLNCMCILMKKKLLIKREHASLFSEECTLSTCSDFLKGGE